MSKYSLGADPEMFVRSPPRNKGPGTKDSPGLIVPVCGKVGGTKDKPISFKKPSPDVSPRALEYKYQEDNVAFEVNIPPCRDPGQFNRSISTVLGYSGELLASKGLRYDTLRSAHRFSAAELMHPSAQTIGCDPDMCAYSAGGDDPVAREPFNIKDLGTWRFTGGHVHFGYDQTLGLPPHVMVRLIDALVYLPIIALDKQKMRRTKYGLAGLYRVKPYGVEYRTMSNFWLTQPSKVATRSFNLLGDVHHNLDLLFDFYQALPIDEVKTCIDQSGAGWQQVWNKITRLPNFRKLEVRYNDRDDTGRSATYSILDDIAPAAVEG